MMYRVQGILLGVYDRGMGYTARGKAGYGTNF